MVLDDVGPVERRPFRGTVEHRIRVANLSGALVPTPPHVERFRLGRVNRPDFFAWAQDGILRMSRRDLPGGVTVETVARVADPEKLRQIAWLKSDPSLPPAYVQVPRGQDELARLAREWATDLPRGWAQVEAVAARLRNEYELDPQARAPADCRDTTRHFLLTSRRGPDYEFASAAVLVLRHLGYAARLATGYYARPEDYDAASGHTPVTGDDVHFWPEVLLPCRIWAVVEPTPGYAVLMPAVPFSERVAAAMRQLADWCAAHPVGSALALALPTILLLWRKRWRDYIGLLWLLAVPGRSWRDWVLRSARLLDRRARWAGRPRPAGLSPCRWYAAAIPADVPARDSLLHLARLADWAAFAPGEPPESPEAVWSACRSAVAEWTLPRFRSARLAPAGGLPCPAPERTDG